MEQEGRQHTAHQSKQMAFPRNANLQRQHSLEHTAVQAAHHE
jgi:hypothetical protein